MLNKQKKKKYSGGHDAPQHFLALDVFKTTFSLLCSGPTACNI